MEWVETTGRTMEEAKEAALEELGVAAEDAEFKVLEEPRSGWFGRVRQEARVRARVRPTSPRPKAERRDRRRKSPEAAPAAPAERPAKAAAAAGTGRARGGRRGAAPAVDIDEIADEIAADVVGEGADVAAEPPRRGGRSNAAASKSAGRGRGRSAAAAPQENDPAADVAADRRRGADVDDEPTLAEQAETVKEFLDGLVDAFGAAGTTEVDEIDDDTLEARVSGDDLGLLIGPKGATLDAVQEITRTVLQRSAEPARGARVRVDIGGYREHRREALARFTRQVADQVLSNGTPVALEPMTPPDRKVVHDTVNEIDGVISSSDGEDPNRRVVISPE